MWWNITFKVNPPNQLSDQMDQPIKATCSMRVGRKTDQRMRKQTFGRDIRDVKNLYVFSDVISSFPFSSSIQFRSVPIFSRSARANFVVSFEYYAHEDDGSDDDTLAARCWVKTRVKQDRIQRSDIWDP